MRLIVIEYVTVDGFMEDPGGMKGLHRDSLQRTTGEKFSPVFFLPAMLRGAIQL